MQNICVNIGVNNNDNYLKITLDNYLVILKISTGLKNQTDDGRIFCGTVHRENDQLLGKYKMMGQCAQWYLVKYFENSISKIRLYFWVFFEYFYLFENQADEGDVFGKTSK